MTTSTTQATLDPVQQAMAQAAAQAEALIAQANQMVPATTQLPANAVPAQFTEEDAIQSGLVVDSWIKVCPDGLLMTKEATAKTAIDSFRAVINMNMGIGYRVMQSISWGNPSKFAKTYNNPKAGLALATDGRNWQQVVAQAKAEDPKCYDFQTAEVAMTLLSQAGTVEEGKVVATSFSFSQHKAWQAFLQEVTKAGLRGKDVEVEIGYKVATKPNCKPWGLFTFKLIGEYFDQE